MRFEDGDLVCREDDGSERGRFYCGLTGLTFEGELTLFQDGEPGEAALRVTVPGRRPRVIGGQFRVAFV